LIYKQILKNKEIVLFLLTPPSPTGEAFKSDFNFSTLNGDIAIKNVALM